MKHNSLSSIKMELVTMQTSAVTRVIFIDFLFIFGLLLFIKSLKNTLEGVFVSNCYHSGGLKALLSESICGRVLEQT